MFNNSSHLNFGNANFSIVHGNQTIIHYLQHEHQHEVPGPGEEEWKLKLYREYDRIPAGRIKIIKTFTENKVQRQEYEDHPENLSRTERWDRSRAKRTAHLACLVQGMKESLPFFSIAYTGYDAQKVFKQDCLKYSQIRYANVIQLQGFNDSSDIPMVHFHEELIPVHHIQRHHKSSTALLCYFSLQASIAKQNMPEWCQTVWNPYLCHNVWIQPNNGRISFGPEGPRPDYFHIDPDPEWKLECCPDIPVLQTSMYNADCITEYLVKYSSAQFLLDILAFNTGMSTHMYPKTEKYPHHTSQVWAHSSGQPLARFQSQWTYEAKYSRFTKEHLHPTVMEDGRICFTINATAQLHMQGKVFSWFRYKVDMPWHRHDWLSQACSVFSMLNIPKDEWSDYVFVDWIDLDINFGTCNYQAEDKFPNTIIGDHIGTNCYYLILHPPPCFPDGFPNIQAWRSGKGLYYYSLDPDGKSVMTESQCLSLQLPFIVPNVVVDAYTWNAGVYDLISAWQEKKGFDPTTINFAHSLGYPIMEVIYSNVNDGHFKDLSEDTDRIDTACVEAMDIDPSNPCSHLPNIGSAFSWFTPVASMNEDVNMMADNTLFVDMDMAVD
ncbi:hypothetical protein E1B28_012046 [Marasmius oreades]|uniref:Uncharacterized protein n=1 Tax=Marasmius oreades TaxID=181124 RepID=A0A9P7UMT8_9AGAR|nr:uncharacterized protein E1B28_012046 [Marasmius oreades]KAG7088007.1 hypothetical protein E1B28_012046 [Marasmius oreades]